MFKGQVSVVVYHFDFMGIVVSNVGVIFDVDHIIVDVNVVVYVIDDNIDVVHVIWMSML